MQFIRLVVIERKAGILMIYFIADTHFSEENIIFSEIVTGNTQVLLLCPKISL